MSPSGRAKRNITVFEQETGLLNMTRLEAGYVKARLDWCDVSDLVQVTLKEIEKDLTQRQLCGKCGVPTPSIRPTTCACPSPICGESWSATSPVRSSSPPNPALGIG